MLIGRHETHPAADVMPLLEGAEFDALCADIEAHGLREPILRAWVDAGFGNGTRKPLILDGRNRLRACEKLRIEPTWRDYEGEDFVELVLSTNLHRRHLSESQRAMVAARVATLSVGKPANLPNRPPTQPEAAARLNVGERTVRSARKVIESGNAGLVAAVDGGRIAVSAAAQVAKMAAEDQAEIVNRLRDDKGSRDAHANAKQVIRQVARDKTISKIESEPKPLPTGKFRVIVADPPWAYTKRKDDGTHRAALTYPDMTTDEICEMGAEIISRAHDDAVLWLWTTNAFMRDAFRVVDAWGFQEKTILTWAKSKMGTGDWLRGKTEHCILAVRGKPVVNLTNQTTLLDGVVREHSRKPDEFYALVESLCPGSKLEIFAREQRVGWSGWGAESEKFGDEECA